MGIWFWLVLAFIGFTLITVIRKWYDQAMLYTIAIGCAINANIYNAINAPMYMGDIIFSIDSVLYTCFMFCVIVCAIEYGVRKAKIMTSATIAAILLSAVIEQLAKMSTNGFNSEYLVNLSGYVFSAVGTFAGVWLMLAVYDRQSKKEMNVYVNMINCLLISSIVNTTIFYIFTRLTADNTTTLTYMLLGSYLGKVFCIALSLLSFFINTHYYIPNNLKDKYPISKLKNIDNR